MLRSEDGQATVELVGMLPAMLLFGAICFQLLASGYAAVMVDNAAQAAAMAQVNGQDVEEAARAAVPGWPEKAVKIESHGERVEVTLKTPMEILFTDSLLEVRADATTPGSV